jgi:hypothetical protein
MYQDEATPGNLLRPDNKRKTQVWYWSFAELGHGLLSKASAWVVAGVLRSTVVSQVKGGLSSAFRALMRLFFGNPHNFATSGITLPCNPGVLVFARLGACLADEAAIKHTWSVKGASGSKPCMLCKNVVEARTGVASLDPTGYLVDIGCFDVALFDEHSDETLWEACDLLQARSGSGTKKAFAALEQSLGVVHEPEGILLDRSLRSFVCPASSTVWDWMHVFLVHGLFQLEAHLLFGRLKDACGWGFPEVAAYMATWHWPSHVKERPDDVFNARRASAGNNAGTFKAGASEILRLYPVMRFMLRMVLGGAGRLDRERCSFDALCSTLDALMAVKSGRISALLLHQRITQHFQAFQVAYPDSGWVPKHHYALHLPGMLRRHGTLWACFVQERRHKVLKVNASRITNTGNFEESLARALFNVHVSWLEEEEFTTTGSFLREERAAPPETQTLLADLLPGAASFFLAASAVCNDRKVAKGDIVQSSNQCGRVVAFVRADERCFAIVHPWHRVAEATWEMQSAALEPFPVEGLAPCIWAVFRGSQAHVLPPVL